MGLKNKKLGEKHAAADVQPPEFSIYWQAKNCRKTRGKKVATPVQACAFPITGGLKNVKKLEKKKSGCSYLGPKIFPFAGG